MAVAADPRLVALREQLTLARRDDEPFGWAWEQARAELLDGLSHFDAENWRRVLASTRWAWRLAYYGSSSTRLDWAMSELEAFATDGEAEPLAYEPAA